MTIRELKTILASWPDKDERGNENEVWTETGDCLSSPVIEATKLNQGDIIFGVHPDVWLQHPCLFKQ